MIIEIALVVIAAFFLLLNIDKVMQNARTHPIIVVVIVVLFLAFSATQIWQKHIKDMEASNMLNIVWI